MAVHNDFGEQGEQQARLYLSQKGYTLLESNWHDGHLELDIIADYHGELVFVEVKTRSSEDFAPAAEAVTPHKRANLVAAARSYLAQYGLWARPYRFDIITVVGKSKPFRITHLRRAFTEQEVLASRRGSRSAFQV